MGEGLKRASAAAARTRWSGTLTPEMKRFLNVLAQHKGVATRSMIGCVTSIAAKKARQDCRKLGLAKVGLQKRGAKREGWQITEAGRQALASA